MKSVSPRLTLLTILALFILPLVLAWLAYTDLLPLQPDDASNRGHLVDPPLPLDWTAVELDGNPAGTKLAGQWVILLKPDIPCEKGCAERVTRIRQVHRALGRHQERVSVALLSEQPYSLQSANWFEGIYPEFKLLNSPDAGFSRALDDAAEVSETPENASAFFLVDPLGNIMMAYNTEDGPSRLSKDLKTLMTWSKQDTP